MGNPGPLGRPVSPELVAAAAVRGITRRSAQVFAPRRWVPFSYMRGAFMAMADAFVDRNSKMQALLRRMEG